MGASALLSATQRVHRVVASRGDLLAAYSGLLGGGSNSASSASNSRHSTAERVADLAEAEDLPARSAALAAITRRVEEMEEKEEKRNEQSVNNDGTAAVASADTAGATSPLARTGRVSRRSSAHSRTAASRAPRMRASNNSGSSAARSASSHNEPMAAASADMAAATTQSSRSAAIAAIVQMMESLEEKEEKQEERPVVIEEAGLVESAARPASRRAPRVRRVLATRSVRRLASDAAPPPERSSQASPQPRLAHGRARASNSSRSVRVTASIPSFAGSDYDSEQDEDYEEDELYYDSDEIDDEAMSDDDEKDEEDRLYDEARDAGAVAGIEQAMSHYIDGLVEAGVPPDAAVVLGAPHHHQHQHVHHHHHAHDMMPRPPAVPSNKITRHHIKERMAKKTPPKPKKGKARKGKRRRSTVAVREEELAALLSQLEGPPSVPPLSCAEVDSLFRLASHSLRPVTTESPSSSSSSSTQPSDVAILQMDYNESELSPFINLFSDIRSLGASFLRPAVSSSARSPSSSSEAALTSAVATVASASTHMVDVDQLEQIENTHDFSSSSVVWGSVERAVVPLLTFIDEWLAGQLPEPPMVVIDDTAIEEASRPGKKRKGHAQVRTMSTVSWLQLMSGGIDPPAEGDVFIRSGGVIRSLPLSSEPPRTLSDSGFIDLTDEGEAVQERKQATTEAMQWDSETKVKDEQKVSEGKDEKIDVPDNDEDRPINLEADSANRSRGTQFILDYHQGLTSSSSSSSSTSTSASVLSSTSEPSSSATSLSPPAPSPPLPIHTLVRNSVITLFELRILDVADGRNGLFQSLRFLPNSTQLQHLLILYFASLTAAAFQQHVTDIQDYLTTQLTTIREINESTVGALHMLSTLFSAYQLARTRNRVLVENVSLFTNPAVNSVVDLYGDYHFHFLHKLTSDTHVTSMHQFSWTRHCRFLYTTEVKSEMIRHWLDCFPEADTRVLTNHGLLFLDEIEALQREGVEVLFGCYDKASKSLQYGKGKLVYSAAPQGWLDFTSPDEAAQLADKSGSVGSESVPEDDAMSLQMSLRVTPGHRMFVQTGNGNEHGHVAWCSPRVGKDSHSRESDTSTVGSPCLVRAESLLSSDAREHVRMLACAEAGYVPLSATRRRAVQAALELTDVQFTAFVELLGFWLGVGSLACAGGVNIVRFSNVKEMELAWLTATFAKAGLEPSGWTSAAFETEECVDITASAWCAYFDSTFGGKHARSLYHTPSSPLSHTRTLSSKSLSPSSSRRNSFSPSGCHLKDDATADEAIVVTDDAVNRDDMGEVVRPTKHMPDWVLLELSVAELRLLIAGLHRAHGIVAHSNKALITRSARLRDQLVQALLHCGYSAHAGVMDHAGNTTAWRVTWADLSDESNSASCCPSIPRQQCITRVPYAAARDGRVWCVEVEHNDHLIIAQRAQRSANGVVIAQSRPIIVGNCHWTQEQVQQAALPTQALTIHISRQRLVPDLLNAIARTRMERGAVELRKPLHIVFSGEEGIDAGGLKKEAVTLACESMFNAQYGMFLWSDETRTFWFNAHCQAHDSVEEMKGEYQLLGTVIGMALLNNVLLPNVLFPPIVYEKLLGLPLSFIDLQTSFPLLHQSLSAILRYDGAQAVEDVFGLTFSIDSEVMGTTHSHPLVPNGESVLVTAANRHEYVRLFTKYQVEDSIATQFDAFARGFWSVLPRHLLAPLLQPVDLELLVCGQREMDFDALEAATKYEGFPLRGRQNQHSAAYHAHLNPFAPAQPVTAVKPTHPVIKHFWSIVHSLDAAQKKQLLHFVTGSSSVPVKGLSEVKLVIANGGSDVRLLPSSRTCFSTLMLPLYKTEAELRKKLLISIEHNTGFGMK